MHMLTTLFKNLHLLAAASWAHSSSGLYRWSSFSYFWAYSASQRTMLQFQALLSGKSKEESKGNEEPYIHCEIYNSIFVAIFAWRMPAQQAFSSIAFGLVFANWPIMWIVFNAMLAINSNWHIRSILTVVSYLIYDIRVVYNVTVRSGIFDVFRRWMLTNAPPDKRVYMIILGFSFCAILEGGGASPCSYLLCEPVVINFLCRYCRLWRTSSNLRCTPGIPWVCIYSSTYHLSTQTIVTSTYYYFSGWSR